MRQLLLLGLITASFALSGCYEDPADVTLHDAGTYKGSPDDLAAASERQDALTDRFKMIQTDR